MTIVIVAQAYSLLSSLQEELLKLDASVAQVSL